ncbi:MAG: 6-bladed beta-propeller, partial [Chloroflexi bacterium]|nr:6-bladed beta-propeller [Chloroflexota bacterium]
DKSAKFVDRFGQQGNEPGQFNGPQQIVVDGKNRVYVKHSLGIEQFDTSGRYLGSLPIDYQKGSPMGLTVDREGFVYVVTNQGKVLKYQLTGR